MAEIHVIQQAIAFALALWWTSKWLIRRPVARWRFAVAALAGALLWVAVAFTSTAAYTADGGTTTVFTALPLAYFAAFMAAVSVIGAVLGLLLWTEEETRDATEGTPGFVRSRLGGE